MTNSVNQAVISYSVLSTVNPRNIDYFFLLLVQYHSNALILNPLLRTLYSLPFLLLICLQIDLILSFITQIVNLNNLQNTLNYLNFLLNCYQINLILILIKLLVVILYRFLNISNSKLLIYCSEYSVITSINFVTIIDFLLSTSNYWYSLLNCCQA